MVRRHSTESLIANMTHETDDTWQEMPEQIFPFVFKKVSISLFQYEFEIEIPEMLFPVCNQAN